MYETRRTCPTCGLLRNESDFRPNARAKHHNRLGPDCNLCVAERQARQLRARAAEAEQRAQRIRQYYDRRSERYRLARDRAQAMSGEAHA